MAPEQAVAVQTATESSSLVDPSQTLRAATALLRKIRADQASRAATSAKADLLADADEDTPLDDTPVWLVLTTKKHIVDQKRLKPGKVSLPHPLLDPSKSNIRICLITADPQRTYKDLIASPSFPLELSSRISRVIGVEKLKAKYKSFESRRQLLAEHDVFLADDRIITMLPQLLGKVFYKTGSKRPVPVTLEGKKQSTDEQGNKRRKLSEGGTKVIKAEPKPKDIARDIQRALTSALVHLAPSTTTSIKVGKSSMDPEQLQQNIEAVIQHVVDKYVPQKWHNVRSIHIKGPDTAALPIWLADELWTNEADVLEEPLPEKPTKSRKRKLAEEQRPKSIEVPGGDGKMRRVERPGAVQSEKAQIDTDERATAKAEKEARKADRKAAKKAAADGSAKTTLRSVIAAS